MAAAHAWSVSRRLVRPAPTGGQSARVESVCRKGSEWPKKGNTFKPIQSILSRLLPQSTCLVSLSVRSAHRPLPSIYDYFMLLLKFHSAFAIPPRCQYVSIDATYLRSYVDRHSFLTRSLRKLREAIMSRKSDCWWGRFRRPREGGGFD